MKNRVVLILLLAGFTIYLLGCGNEWKNCTGNTYSNSNSKKADCDVNQAVFDSFEYVIYFKDETNRKVVDVVIEHLTKKIPHPHLVKKKCGCGPVYLMEIPQHLDPETQYEEGQSAVSHWGGTGRNYRFNIGSPGFDPGGPYATSSPDTTPLNNQSVIVGIVDMGVEFSHPFLKENFWRNPSPFSPCFPNDTFSYNFYSNTHEDVFDHIGHGTHIAGIISLKDTDSGNPNYGSNRKDLRLMSLKITEEDKKQSDLFTAICAIDYSINREVEILNLSWGYYAPEPDSALIEVLLDAKQRNVLVVASAGNDSLDTDKCRHWPSGLTCFSDFNHLISVAALDNSNPANLASFSNYGKHSVDIAARGLHINSTYIKHDCKNMKGTSMAAPFVSRMAAIIKFQYPLITNTDLRIKILDTYSDHVPGQIPPKKPQAHKFIALSIIKSGI